MKNAIKKKHTQKLNKAILSVIEKVKLENNIVWKMAELNEAISKNDYTKSSVHSAEITKISNRIIKLDDSIKTESLLILKKSVENDLSHMIDEVGVRIIKSKYSYLLDSILYELVTQERE